MSLIGASISKRQEKERKREYNKNNIKSKNIFCSITDRQTDTPGSILDILWYPHKIAVGFQYNLISSIALRTNERRNKSNKRAGSLTKEMGIVPLVATLLEELFVAFLKWILIGYFRLG